MYKTNLRCSTIQSNMLEYSDYFFVINSSKIISVQKMCCFVTFINKRKSRLYADSVRQELQFFYTSEAKTTSLLSYTGPPWKHGNSDWGAQYLCTDCYSCGKDPDRLTRKPMNRRMNAALENNCQVNKLTQM